MLPQVFPQLSLLIKAPGALPPGTPRTIQDKAGGETKSVQVAARTRDLLRVGGVAGTVRPQPWAVSSIGPPRSANLARLCFVPAGVVTPGGTTKIGIFWEIQEIRPNFYTPGVPVADSTAFRAPDDQRSTPGDPCGRMGFFEARAGGSYLDSEAAASHHLPGSDATRPGDALPGYRPGQELEHQGARSASVLVEDPADPFQGGRLVGGYFVRWLR